jgi:parallel beta-helix repeat protein
MALDKKQKLSLIAVALLLLSAIATTNPVTLSSASYVPWIWHNSSIFICSNGTISPPDAPILNNGNVYTLKTDVFDGIAIQKNDVILDGNGYRMFGNLYGTGILLDNVRNVTVQNVNVQFFQDGLYLDHCNDTVIKGNSLTGCGMEVSPNSHNNQITQNSIDGTISMDESSSNLISANSASEISIAWSQNITVSNNQVADDKLFNGVLTFGNFTEGIYIDNSSNCTVAGNTVERKGVGVDLWYCTNLTLTDNTLRDNLVGFKLYGAEHSQILLNIDQSNTVNGKPIYLLYQKNDYQVPLDAGWIVAVDCQNLVVQNWVSTPNWDGILLIDSKNPKITNCTLAGNFNAIHLENVSNCIITKNTISNSQYTALQFEGATDCKVTENEVFDNYCLFDVWRGSVNNTFYHNNFEGNLTGCVDLGSQNVWDNGAEGNYWSSFTGVDFDRNKISDTPFVINSYSSAVDRYPFMEPVNSQATVQMPIENTNGLILAMPQEYLNYTVTNTTGTLVAIVDGVYPIHLGTALSGPLPMLYPIPPNTTNIQIWLDGTELSFANYTNVDSTALHHTAIGDWQMIYCTIKPAYSDFLLKIHYEHPIQVIDGSYTFLYDLNIAPYLSPSSVTSTAHFNVQLPLTIPNLSVYTTGTSGGWTSVNGNTTQTSTGKTVTFNVTSNYGRTLPGDIAFVFKQNQVPEFPPWLILPLLAALMLCVLAFRVKKRAF